jgi:hypothetical protein
MRILRNVILHSKGIIRYEKHKDLKKLSNMFIIDRPVNVSYQGMHQIFVLIKQDCARMLFEWLGLEDPPIKPEEMVDLAIQKKDKPSILRRFHNTH